MNKGVLDALDRQLCAEASTGFFVDLDRGYYDCVLDYLTDDIQWMRRGQELTGRDAVLAALKARPPSIISRHFVTNVVTTAISEAEAENYFTVLAFQSDEATGQPGPRKIAGPAAIITGIDKLVRVGDRWKIHRKESEVTFMIR